MAKNSNKEQTSGVKTLMNWQSSDPVTFLSTELYWMQLFPYSSESRISLQFFGGWGG